MEEEYFGFFSAMVVDIYNLNSGNWEKALPKVHGEGKGANDL